MRSSVVDKFFNFGVLCLIKKRLQAQTFFIRFFKKKTGSDLFPRLSANAGKKIRVFDTTFAINYRCFDARLLQNRVILLPTTKKTASASLLIFLSLVCFVLVGFSLGVLMVTGIYPVAQLILVNTYLTLVHVFFTSAYTLTYVEFCIDFFIIKGLLSFFQIFFTQIYLLFSSVVFFLAYA